MAVGMMKYYGIDIGDGESAAAAVAEKGAVVPEVLMLGTTRSMLSVVGDLNGKPVVGDQALLRQSQGAHNIKARFKSRYLTDDAASADIRRFAQGLYDLMKDEFAGVAQPHIALGVPAGWSDTDRRRYAGIVSEAGFRNMHAVAESRAAFLFARYDKDIGLSVEELSRPALVIDIGSSTTDFAYIVDGKETEVGVFGDKSLGGGLLDQLILEDAVARSPKSGQIRAVFDRYPEWRSICELAARKAKETYFSSEADWAVDPYVSKVYISADVNSPASLSFSLDSKRMRKLLATPIPALDRLTFPEQLRRCLELAAKNTIRHPPELLILTGGASRMNFFQQACRDAFPNANVTICPEPEFCIARGLSIAARIDYKLSVFKRKIEDFFESGDLRKDINLHLPALQKKLSGVLMQRIMRGCIEPALKEDCATRDQLNAAINSNIKKEFEKQGRTPESDDIIAAWITEELSETRTKLDNLCLSSDVERADLALSKIGVKVEMNKLNILPVLLPDFLYQIIILIAKFNPNLVRKNVWDALQNELADPRGVFANTLAGGLEAELRAQIQKNVEKVEIHIS